MKKLFLSAVAVGLSLSMMIILGGCLKDSTYQTYTIFTPIYKNLSAVRKEMKSTIPQPLVNTGKIYVYGNYIFLNEVNKGIHIIDNTDRANPRNLSFINIPGNVDLAVKGNYLYADSYSDIVVFDISNPANITPKTFLNNVFKDYGYYWGNYTSPDSVSVVVGYNQKDTTVTEGTYQRWQNCPTCVYVTGILTTLPIPAVASTATGKGGSMARLSIVNDYMYGVSTSRLYAFNISDPAQPYQTSIKSLNWGIETIFPFKDKLFIGSSNGVFIFDISNPSEPVYQSQFFHFTSCDPVIADGDYAYVTLHSGTSCHGTINEMDVLNISNLNNPTEIRTYSMTNPIGLSKDGNTLLVCDGKDGLKFYNATYPNALELIKAVGGIETYDVITINGKAIVVAKDGLYQYDYSDLNNIHLISKISISKI
jgi:hypothetical protein